MISESGNRTRLFSVKARYPSRWTNSDDLIDGKKRNVNIHNADNHISRTMKVVASSNVGSSGLADKWGYRTWYRLLGSTNTCS
jgi:hypothetical protein